MKLITLVFVLLLGLGGCTDAKIGKLKSFGGSGHVRCWSGPLLIYEGTSTGKISNSMESDGYYFVDKTTNKLVEVSGNCVIEYTKY